MNESEAPDAATGPAVVRAHARDPFKAAREGAGIQRMQAEGEAMPLVLRLQDLRRVAKDWQRFSNDDPLMIVPHSEADVRDVRQLPIETDPPQHTAYRALIEPTFRRPRDPAYIRRMETLVERAVDAALAQGEGDAVRGFALPLQSRALALLLHLPLEEAERWIGWGVHVYHDSEDGEAARAQARQVDDYFTEAFAAATDPDATDFFNELDRAQLDGRPLTAQEKRGFAHMTFAGGRDTVISTVSSILAHLAQHPEVLAFLREDPARVVPAAEEYVRWVSPLTAIARRCPAGADLPGDLDVTVPPGGRVGLCWPSANRDGDVFDRADEVVPDRAPNPHVGFGFGAHNCLGQHQARLILRTLLATLARRVGRLTLLSSQPRLETESSFERQVGWEHLELRWTGR